MPEGFRGSFIFVSKSPYQWHKACGGSDETVSLLFSFFPAFFRDGNWVDLMGEFIEYEAMTFALGGAVVCPDCGMGYLIPIETPPEDAQRLVCDVCDEVFELSDEAG